MAHSNSPLHPPGTFMVGYRQGATLHGQRRNRQKNFRGRPNASVQATALSHLTPLGWSKVEPKPDLWLLSRHLRAAGASTNQSNSPEPGTRREGLGVGHRGTTRRANHELQRYLGELRRSRFLPSKTRYPLIQHVGTLIQHLGRVIRPPLQDLGLHRASFQECPPATRGAVKIGR